MSKQATRFELRVGEIYRNLEKGLTEIEENLAAAKKARLSNLPTELFTRFLPHVKSNSKKVELFPKSEEQREALKAAGFDWKFSADSELLASFWYQDFIGERLHMGEVITEGGLWHILYKDDGEVRRITSNTDEKFRELIWQKNFMMRYEGDHCYATVYDRHEGLKVISQRARTGTVFRATVVPPYLLKDVIPVALQGDYRFILSRRDPLAKHFSEDTNVRYASRAKIFYVYGEEETNVGSLRIDGDYYSIFWRGNDVHAVMRLDNRDLANRLSRVFDTAWKYSETV